MRNWINRFLAAIGVGGRKAEADVSYDSALDDEASGGDIRPSSPPHPGGSRVRGKFAGLRVAGWLRLPRLWRGFALRVRAVARGAKMAAGCP
jgi:hypothetical protein